MHLSMYYFIILKNTIQLYSQSESTPPLQFTSAEKAENMTLCGRFSLLALPTLMNILKGMA